MLEESYPPVREDGLPHSRNRPDAEDAVQEAFLRAWKFRNSLAKETSVRPWLYRVVVNTCNSKLRQDIPRRERSDPTTISTSRPSTSKPPIDSPPPTTSLGALKTYPFILRIVIILRYYAELSEREIAIAIGRKPGTVKSRLHDARRR